MNKGFMKEKQEEKKYRNLEQLLSFTIIKITRHCGHNFSLHTHTHTHCTFCSILFIYRLDSFQIIFFRKPKFKIQNQLTSFEFGIRTMEFVFWFPGQRYIFFFADFIHSFLKIFYRHLTILETESFNNNACTESPVLCLFFRNEKKKKIKNKPYLLVTSRNNSCQQQRQNELENFFYSLFCILFQKHFPYSFCVCA